MRKKILAGLLSLTVVASLAGFSQIASAPWINIAVVSAVCIVICAILLIIGAKIKVKSKKTV